MNNHYIFTSWNQSICLRYIKCLDSGGYSYNCFISSGSRLRLLRFYSCKSNFQHSIDLSIKWIILNVEEVQLEVNLNPMYDFVKWHNNFPVTLIFLIFFFWTLILSLNILVNNQFSLPYLFLMCQSTLSYDSLLLWGFLLFMVNCFFSFLVLGKQRVLKMYFVQCQLFVAFLCFN